jgi:hypothetical protein
MIAEESPTAPNGGYARGVLALPELAGLTSQDMVRRGGGAALGLRAGGWRAVSVTAPCCAVRGQAGSRPWPHEFPVGLEVRALAARCRASQRICAGQRLVAWVKESRVGRLARFRVHSG